VTQVGVFALVGDISVNKPADYLKQQKGPYFGSGFDATLDQGHGRDFLVLDQDLQPGPQDGKVTQGTR
jgi:hypothetical protein